MLFHSSIRQELARSFVATLVVLITVVMSMMLIRSLGLASRGSVNPRDVIMLMGYSALGHLSTVMTLSLFIAVTNTLSRMYRDSEMVIWFASGKGLSSFVRPVLRFAWPILLAITALALIVWPWTAQQTNKLRNQYEQRSDLDRVSVGHFQENASGSRVFFIESNENSAVKIPAATTDATALNRQAKNVFVSESRPDMQVITSARGGAIETRQNDAYIVLKQGQRVEQSNAPGKESSQIRLVEFEEYAVLVRDAQISTNVMPAKSKDTIDLLRQPTPLHLAELSWRLGIALAACNLLLLALLLSAVNPRVGRSFGVAFALLAFVVYYNLLSVGFARIASEHTSFGYWMASLHGGVFWLTLFWLVARHKQWSWRQCLPRRASPSSCAAVA